jgi:hypothetical protein
MFDYIHQHCLPRFSSATFSNDLFMPTKIKAATANPKKLTKRKPSRSMAKVENLMTNEVSIPIPPSNPASRKRASKKSKGFVETVKEDVRSAIKAVGKFVEKAGSSVPPVKKRKPKTIVPRFTSPI